MTECRKPSKLSWEQVCRGEACLADGAQGGVEALLLEPRGELAVAALHRAQVLQVVRQRLPAFQSCKVMGQLLSHATECGQRRPALTGQHLSSCLTVLALPMSAACLCLCWDQALRWPEPLSGRHPDARPTLMQGSTMPRGALPRCCVGDVCCQKGMSGDYGGLTWCQLCGPAGRERPWPGPSCWGPQTWSLG